MQKRQIIKYNVKRMSVGLRSQLFYHFSRFPLFHQKLSIVQIYGVLGARDYSTATAAACAGINHIESVIEFIILPNRVQCMHVKKNQPLNIFKESQVICSGVKMLRNN